MADEIVFLALAEPGVHLADVSDIPRSRADGDDLGGALSRQSDLDLLGEVVAPGIVLLDLGLLGRLHANDSKEASPALDDLLLVAERAPVMAIDILEVVLEPRGARSSLEEVVGNVFVLV